MELTQRQLNELEYHRVKAKHTPSQRVNLDVVTQDQRRWWNAYWHTWTILRDIGSELRGKRVLVVGCGFGEDAIRLAKLGCEVSAFDLSPESIRVAADSAELMYFDIEWSISAAERMPYPDHTFDLVLCIDILHHVDIEACMNEIIRVSKPRAVFVANEIYTHSWLTKIRESRAVKAIYPLMRRWVYGTDTPYITADERKLNEGDLKLVEGGLRWTTYQYFNLLVGRIFPDRWDWLAKLDRWALQNLRSLGRYFAARVVMVGRLE